MKTTSLVLLCFLVALTAARAAGWTADPFERPAGANPIIAPDRSTLFDCPMRGRPIRWQALHTFNPAAVVKDGRVHLLYRAEDDTGAGIGGHTSRLGLAVSEDGIHFARRPAPVFFPADDGQRASEWDGGCEDPRLVEAPDGTYVLTYTQWNRRVPRLAVATSRDLVHWRKHGPAFARAARAYTERPSKSGAIVCRLDGDRLKAARIGGRYFMYWGEGGVAGAWSDDLVSWTPVEERPGTPRALLAPRSGAFDSELAEGGPPAVLTARGIWMFYNGKNAAQGGDPTLGPGAYAGGEALFDGADPTRLLERLERPSFRPELAFEKTGQYPSGTTFLEALIHFRGRWFLYYGCADSLVGVAVSERGPVGAAAGAAPAAPAELSLVEGQPGWTLASDQVELAVTRAGAQTGPVTFYRRDARPVRPYHVSPWQREHPSLLDCPVMVPLRGDFFCLPFGGNATPYRGERHPPHGETAGSPWSLSARTIAGPVRSITLTLAPRVRAGEVTRTLSLVDGQNAIYDSTTIRGFAGPTSMAHHPILALPQTARALVISMRPFRFGMTAPYRFGDPAKREYQSLAIGARFTDLARVPSIFRGEPDADRSAFPARRGFADLLEVFATSDPSPDWFAAVNTEEHTLFYALKDPRVLPGRVLWIEDHGRHAPPWSGRNACLGVEDCCAFFDAGLSESAAPNVVNAAGIPTSHTLDGVHPFVVNVIQGVVRVPPGFGRVAAAELAPNRATFVSGRGQRVTARVHVDFLRTGRLP